MTTPIADMVERMLASGVAPDMIALAVKAAERRGMAAPKSNLNTVPCYVYTLIDPRTERPFYIGISINPWYRFEQHKNDTCSSAWPVIQDMVDEGFECLLEVVAEHPNRAAAFEHEYNLISSTPGLVNIDRNRRRAWP